MKPPWEWDEDDLLALITNGTKESIELDYKACDALAKTDGKKKEVSKDVSALANSAGGTIVYGMCEDGYVPVRVDSGYDPSVISKEWLDQVINSGIQRRIDGVRINQVELVKRNQGKVAYVVYVPQSMRAAHQAADKRFYKRFNFESVPMEEYEVRDVSRRSEAPDLRLRYQLSLSKESTAGHTSDEAQPVVYSLMPIITNDATTPAEYTVMNLFIDARLPILRNKNRELIHLEAARQLEVGGHSFSCTQLQMNHAIPGKMPLFHGVVFQMLESPLLLRIPELGTYVLGWQLLSPRMTPKADAIFLRFELEHRPGLQPTPTGPISFPVESNSA